MSEIKIFSYNGNGVTFRKGESVMVNATEMAKPFGKEAKHWLLNSSTKDFIEELANVRNLTFDKLVYVKQGSPDNGGGTWMHEDVAMEFARWLSPKFAIWCNDRIKELMQVGFTATPSTLEAMLANPDLVIGMATQLKQLRAENEEKQRKIDADAPKVLYADSTAAAKTSCLGGELAKILTQNGYEIGQNRLFKKLREEGYLGTKGEYYNVPNQRYQEMGLFEVKKSIINNPDGSTFQKSTTKVTGRGQIYFVNKFLGQKNRANTPQP